MADRKSEHERSLDLLRNSFVKFYVSKPVGEAGTATKDTIEAGKLLREALLLRKKYLFVEDSSRSISKSADTVSPYKFAFVNGVGTVYADEAAQAKGTSLFSVHGPLEFHRDFQRIMSIATAGPVKTFSAERLKFLQFKYQCHKLLNGGREERASLHDPKDFSSVMKVDTHIHLAAAMTGKHLLDYIRGKLASEPDRVVEKTKSGEDITLRTLFEQNKIDMERFTVDALDVRGDDVFHRFDNFNAHYNPFGKSELRTVFLKTSNTIHGEYFAEMTNQIFDRIEEAGHEAAEMRISIYGTSPREWDELSSWVINHNVYSDKNCWLVQVPRIYDLWKRIGRASNFQQVLSNIFEPLFRVTIDPSSNPTLHEFLKEVSGFDSVDDESKLEVGLTETTWEVDPTNWDRPENPPYSYYMYYMWANIQSLNLLRQQKGLNTFDMRPHCGESGDVDHLGSSFLVARGVNHGIALRDSAGLQYLYYLAQVGLAVSPLSNNKLFLQYDKNPFNQFFERGLNVSLSTDDPLQFHYTQSPLLEEYSIASQRWALNSGDLSEIARNSVLQSGFSHEFKKKWLGPQYLLPGVEGNDIHYTNVTDIRVEFRTDTLHEELSVLHACVTGSIQELRSTLSCDMDTASHDYTKLQMYSPAVPILEPEEAIAAKKILGLLNLREKYYHRTAPWSTRLPERDSFPKDVKVVWKDSVATLVANDKILFEPVSWSEFLNDMNELGRVSTEGTVCTFSYHQMKLLDIKYRFHQLMNSPSENRACKLSSCDFYNIFKVDVHVHGNSAMSADHLLDFIKRKAQAEPSKVVIVNEDKSTETLEAMMKSLNIDPENLTLDTLDVRAADTFKRYDRFANKYSPFGNSNLRRVFLKHENEIEGSYFGELLREVFDHREKTPYTLTEVRITIYGAHMQEWVDLAKWWSTHRLNSPINHWVIQLPRLYHLYHKAGKIQSFDELLKNFFTPLFDATLNPEAHPLLASFLEDVSAFDSVDKETSAEPTINTGTALPAEWTTGVNPNYSYYLYYMWSSLETLNRLRSSRGMNTFDFRPHCGSAGSHHHLLSAYLLSTGISHGLQLDSSITMQYLYYLTQIGIAMSPLLENTVYCRYDANPFDKFFRRGLRVCLSSDNPTQIHMTDEPLIEEYAIAAQMWRYSSADMSEIARNSVLISSFADHEKAMFIGKDYHLPGKDCNDIEKTNVPATRVSFRYDTLDYERQLLFKADRYYDAEGKITPEAAAVRDSEQELRRQRIATAASSLMFVTALKRFRNVLARKRASSPAAAATSD
mmetsp:Transcript_14246/g.36439  ORF Transcript_14246/g.36439 Transcript_14246/m.36439 type:complete len:1280 (+) Transcript_14246:43-3882(+)